jgi:RimJ/RimL family protein N-acetyltransferase
MIFLRPATMEDSGILLAWRNDVTTFINFLVQKPVPPKRHDLWMEINVKYGYPTRIVLMAEDTMTEDAVGVIDFVTTDPQMKSYEISITVAPRMRSRGLGKQILTLGCERMRGRILTASVRTENGRSRKIFESCGFKLIRSDKEFDHFRKEPK